VVSGDINKKKFKKNCLDKDIVYIHEKS